MPKAYAKRKAESREPSKVSPLSPSLNGLMQSITQVNQINEIDGHTKRSPTAPSVLDARDIQIGRGLQPRAVLVKDVLDDGRGFAAHVVAGVGQEGEEEDVELVPDGQKSDICRSARSFAERIGRDIIKHLQMVFHVIGDVPNEWDLVQETDARWHVIDQFEQLHSLVLDLKLYRVEHRRECCKMVHRYYATCSHVVTR